ncbi:DNA helicase-2 / ATP-dependent DNA helicase PcrA [Methanobrevibacter gottschalkii]|uniref:DNA 3'-5' helicase n=2 Tax=Methanobrevibacter gottschalkii TaxID=190974 RepID=A0A3N5BQ88_9EURY|nr:MULTISPECIES: DEAD/DEAH box helicase [Methanobrevibacter]MCQ2970259.1 DEAD/DEAH box helicase [archaeon]OEC98732.1 AAA family ATPase [Methanobrevibacter sp. A27]RPF51928.1 DNA helicase-2/ATP-dependent DNA helicase PcrA [Methanobrevibacter gottschalkii DSM 11977]SEL30213.1 DNA helicase-2 / ATP-dependent DNA helicase PcrA [Methanobrevibacter gottschalkii]
MISYEEFEDMVVNILKRDISSNKEQKNAILAPCNKSLFLVAGPGSGKTTVMVLKILKYIFVDDIEPNEIIATTFTRKAADELYSRILGWGDMIKNHLLNTIHDFNNITKITRIDFNQIKIGTTDSIAEELLREYKKPGENQAIVIEGFVANSAMIKIIIEDEKYLNKNLVEYLKEVSGKEKIEEPSKLSEILIEIKNRIYYDQVDFNELYNKTQKDSGARIALDCIKKYEDKLQNRNTIDFAMLESEFLKKLKNNELETFLNETKIVLIDEYQDTNLLQEDIYFTIARSAIANNGNITVVGDDDQSLYRFRGATVDLFTTYQERINEKLGIEVEEINLRTNYRSTENIIEHCNQFAELDSEYQNARVENKPKIIAPDFDNDKMPILGMFRNNPEMLAKDLSKLINQLVNKGEAEIKVLQVLNKEYYEKVNGVIDIARLQQIKAENVKAGKEIEKITLKLDSDYGSASDIAILSYSPKETYYGNRSFLHYLRKNLKKLRQPIEVFNPRGIELQDIDIVGIFCGLMLECIDPDSTVQKSDKTIPKLATHNMRRWRIKAKDFIKLNPEPHEPITLSQFVTYWQLRRPRGHEEWPKTASLMELAYKITTWIEELQEDVEGIVYLEAITQSITQTGFFNDYHSNISFRTQKQERESILEAIWNIFIPLSTGGIQIDESLLETLPDNRINVLSIHQSKGLEFPLVIVDVGSRFKQNDIRTQKLRFPKSIKEETTLEDRIRRYSKIGQSKRGEKDKSFDDLTRLYFVAFSRAEKVLLLIGLNPAIEGYNKKNNHFNIPNVALGWSRDEKYIGFNEIYLI